MSRTLAATATALALIAAAAAAPAAPEAIPLAGTDQAAAQVTKSRGSGASSDSADAARLGDRAARLGSGWAIPLTIFIAGALLTWALLTRNLGAAVGVILVAILALIFFASPDSVRRFAEGVGEAIF